MTGHVTAVTNARVPGLRRDRPGAPGRLLASRRGRSTRRRRRGRGGGRRSGRGGRGHDGHRRRRHGGRRGGRCRHGRGSRHGIGPHGTRRRRIGLRPGLRTGRRRRGDDDEHGRRRCKGGSRRCCTPSWRRRLLELGSGIADANPTRSGGQRDERGAGGAGPPNRGHCCCATHCRVNAALSASDPANEVFAWSTEPPLPALWMRTGATLLDGYHCVDVADESAS
jgi:hypothetical protein